MLKYTVHDVDNPESDTYELVGIEYEPVPVGGQGAGAYSEDHGIFLRLSGLAPFTYWDLNGTLGDGNRNINFTPTINGGSIDNIGFYGLDYDEKRKRFLPWGGDSDV